MRPGPGEHHAAEIPPGAKAPADISLRAVGPQNWRACAGLKVADDQQDFVAPVSYYLALCHYGGIWQPLAVYAADQVVGFAMWAFDPGDQSGWVGGLTVDAERQGQGIGRAAMERLLVWLRDGQLCSSAALSYQPTNLRAKGLYASLGFAETGEMEDDELVARLGL